MKYKVLLILSLLCVALSSCKKNEYEGLCVIEGSINPRFNGKQVLIVPLDAPYDATRIDSMVVKDCMFRFVRDTTEMCRITVERRSRIAVQDLLVVTEPGVVKVVIDTISDCSGTRQNDSISVWKSCSMEYNKTRYGIVQEAKKARRAGDTLTVNKLQAEIDTLHKNYKRRTRQIADNLGEGCLHDFLWKMYPTHYTYKKRMPDGTIVEVEKNDD